MPSISSDASAVFDHSSYTDPKTQSSRGTTTDPGDGDVSSIAYYRRPTFPASIFPSISMNVVLLMLASIVTATAAHVDQTPPYFDSKIPPSYFSAPLENGQNGVYAIQAYDKVAKDVIDSLLNVNQCGVNVSTNLHNPIMSDKILAEIYHFRSQTMHHYRADGLCQMDFILRSVNSTMPEINKALLCLIFEVQKTCEIIEAGIIVGMILVLVLMICWADIRDNRQKSRAHTHLPASREMAAPPRIDSYQTDMELPGTGEENQRLL